jgi:tripartite-type tricarboxylate transporter receptor subunit TctC
VKELGVATGVPPGHNGLFAPRGLPANVRAALENTCRTIVKQEAVQKVMANTGQSLEYLDGVDFQAQTVADYKLKGELIKRLGLGMQQN